MEDFGQPFFYMAFASCVNVYGELCAHEQHVKRTLTLTHTITAYLVSRNVVDVCILICSTRQKPCRKRVYRRLHGPSLLAPSPPLDNIRVMVIVWRLRGNIIRTALCWVVWHNVHGQQHTYVSSSYRSSRLGLSHWDPYAMHTGGCLELYYCNMVEWSWWDSSIICKTN